ncbi:hypothetical protein MIR68_007606 [Amoeboaphelidium protococcarum]|nr:hypothetical protein MIR68_007606 [Amoeboaphelidium protococcarum]
MRMLQLSWIPKYMKGAAGQSSDSRTSPPQTSDDDNVDNFQQALNGPTYQVPSLTSMVESPKQSTQSLVSPSSEEEIRQRTLSDASGLTLPSLHMSITESDESTQRTPKDLPRFPSLNDRQDWQQILDLSAENDMPSTPKTIFHVGPLTDNTQMQQQQQSQAIPSAHDATYNRDSMFDSAAAADVEEEDEDAKHERRCVDEAKALLARCIISDRHLNDYCLTMLLGYGTFGIVVQGIRCSDGQKVAIKIMRKSQIHSSRLCKDPRTGEPSCLEIALLKYAPQHLNIIKYIDSWEGNECWFLVTECGGYAWNRESLDPLTKLPAVLTRLFLPNHKMPTSLSASRISEFDRLVLKSGQSNMPEQRVIIPRNGNDQSLAGLLRVCGGFSKTCRRGRHRGPVLPEPVQKRIFYQIAESVASLHHCGITHKDLKDENVLVDADLTAKLIDFGHAAFYQTPIENPGIRPFKSYGTPIFSPPEVRSGMTFIGPEADIYAMGMMLYEMNYGDLPDNFDEAHYVPNGPCVFEVSSDTGFPQTLVRDLVQWMLCCDPVDRPSIDQVLSHPWFGHSGSQ